ncbi:MAG: PD-(D/E)XK nuclease family protein [Thermoplasmatota archaeon]
MSGYDQDRLISASEVERWSYCPMSWKLERMYSPEEKAPLKKGEEKHRKLGSHASKAIKAAKSERDISRTTWVYLAFAVIILMMGVSLLFFNTVGSLDIHIWRVMVLALSIGLIGSSLAFYFFRSGRKKADTRGALRTLSRDIEEGNIKGSRTSLLFYLFGIALMINGIILLRPFGINEELASSVLAISLMALYVLIFVTMTLYFRSHRDEWRGGRVKLGLPLVLMFLISVSVLFIFISDEVDPEGDFGWVFLVISLLWFLGAIGYDLLSSLRRGDRPDTGGSEGDLPVAALALVASVFTASTFLAKGDNLDEYYIATIVVAGAWLLGAIFFFWRGSVQRRLISDVKEKLSIPESARVVSADDLNDRGGSKPLVSKKHYLVGSPDMVIEEKGYRIPIEVKTGRVPHSPFLSHQMQLGAYLILMDTNFRQDTPYGYIDYVPDVGKMKRFRIEWDMVTKALVLSKVSEIRESERTGVAHRNHDREGKCRNCSRRQGCPERLV